MAQRIRNCVETCSVCNSSKKAKRKAKCPLTKYHSGAPMERVHLDFLGPLPETTQGNAHILVMVDQFSKWLECTPLPTQTAEQTATAAVNEFFSRFGFPFKIFTDQGRNFESRLFKSICDVLQIHKTRTTPYRPSSNGQVGHCYRTDGWCTLLRVQTTEQLGRTFTTTGRSNKIFCKQKYRVHTKHVNAWTRSEPTSRFVIQIS